MEFRAVQARELTYIRHRGKGAENEKQEGRVGKWSPTHLQIIRPRNKSLDRHAQRGHACVYVRESIFVRFLFFLIRPIRSIGPSWTVVRGKILTRKLFRTGGFFTGMSNPYGRIYGIVFRPRISRLGSSTLYLYYIPWKISGLPFAQFN